MPLTKRGNLVSILDKSSRRKLKHSKPHQIAAPQENAKRINSVSFLVSESKEQVEIHESDETKVIISSNSEDSIIKFVNKKSRRNATYLQFTSVLESPHKCQLVDSSKLIGENM